MNTIFKLFLSMSCSGALLILALFLGKRFIKDRLSRQWQYYIWLPVIMRLLLPFGAEINLMGKIYQAINQGINQAIDQATTKEDPLPQQQPPAAVQDSAPAVGLGQNQEMPDQAETLTAAHIFQDIASLLTNNVWLIWLSVALGMLIRKATVYQSFVRYINSGSTPVSDIGILDRLSIHAEQMGIKRPVELCANPQVSSPLLTGFFHPCIVLPSVDISEKDFRHTMLHELTHYKRRDMFYKWLVQATVCLHWFNPFVHLMSREIAKACEFSCDEAVLAKIGYANAEDYGKTLLDAMAAVGKCKRSPGTVTLSENKKILKERLAAIIRCKRKSKAIQIFTGLLTLCMVFGASCLGVYPVAATSNQVSEKTSPPGLDDENPLNTQGRTEEQSKASSLRAEQYYEADSLPLFQIAFSRLDGKEQLAWLEKLYADGDFAFFSVAVRTLSEDNPLLASFAEKAYSDDEIAFFSNLADCMDEAKLELWLDRALEDERWNFQSILFDRLDMEDEKDVWGNEWAEQQMAEYQAIGVTKDGKNYYYQKQLVNVFLDIRPDQSFYTLDTNPAGTVNIKIIRGEDGQVTDATYMAEEEVAELLGDMGEPDDF